MVRWVGATIGMVISAPLLVTCFRAFIFFGKVMKTVDGIELQMVAHTAEQKGIALEMREIHTELSGLYKALDHRVTVIEVERNTEAKYGRRRTDQPRTDDQL